MLAPRPAVVGSLRVSIECPHKQTTPRSPLSKHVRQHCAQLCRASKPVFLPFTPIDARYLPKFCHLNVMHAVERFGGRRVFGWVIWELAKFKFVEGEFHSVWETPEGHLVDLTPRVDGEAEILFLRDDRRRIERVAGRDFAYANRTNGKLPGCDKVDRVPIEPNLAYGRLLDELGYPRSHSLVGTGAA